MKYVIIAAGEGSRLVQEGVAVPKPLVDLDGRPLIGRLLDIFEELGAESVSVIVNQQMTDVQHYVRARMASDATPIHLTVKSTPSSMHSFYEATRNLGEGRFIATTVDTVFDHDAFARYALAFENSTDSDGYMAVTKFIDDEKPLYVHTDADGYITAFTDTPSEGVRFISGGIYGLNHKALDVLQQCMDNGVSRMRNFQRALVDAGLRLRAYDLGKILDVDHAGDIEKARIFITAKGQ